MCNEERKSCQFWRGVDHVEFFGICDWMAVKNTAGSMNRQLRIATKMAEGTDDRTDLFPSALCNCSQKSAIHVHCYCK